MTNEKNAEANNKEKEFHEKAHELLKKFIELANENNYDLNVITRFELELIALISAKFQIDYKNNNFNQYLDSIISFCNIIKEVEIEKEEISNENK